MVLVDDLFYFFQHSVPSDSVERGLEVKLQQAFGFVGCHFQERSCGMDRDLTSAFGAVAELNWSKDFS